MPGGSFARVTPPHWIGYRRIDDGELLGYVVPAEQSLFAPVVMSGYRPNSSRGPAEQRQDEVGLDCLAGRWTLRVADHSEPIGVEVVEVVEANPETLTVKNVDYGSRPNCGHRFTLGVPVTSGLRHAYV